MKTVARYLSAFAVVSVTMLIQPATSQACFDTYLFLQKRSLVVPQGMAVVEGSGEYVVPRLKDSGQDFLSGGSNFYYGVTDRFSFQLGVASAEKTRSNFRLDGYGIRGVFGLVQNLNDIYNLDAVVEHTGPFNGSENVFELSTPNVFHVQNLTFVVHPVTSFGRNVNFNVRGHGGAFYRMGDTGIVGLGAEFASAQSGSQFGRRLVKGEGATSLFFGAQIGKYAFLQNELIKGWGTGGNDFGFAMSVKLLMPALTSDQADIGNSAS